MARQLCRGAFGPLRREAIKAINLKDAVASPLAKIVKTLGYKDAYTPKPAVKPLEAGLQRIWLGN
jgi:hypothetical protein